MKTKQYTITTGEYDSYCIVTIVEGPLRPALSTLYKRFKEEFSAPDPKGKGYDWELLKAFVEEEMQCNKRLEELGYVGDSISGKFVDWLVKHHGFVIKCPNEFHVNLN